MLKNFPPPQNVTQLRFFLSLLQFFREMLPHLSHVCHLLYKCTSSCKSFSWTPELQNYFEIAKEMLHESLLRNTFDSNAKSIVFTDASKYAICAVLTQDDKLITCTSKTLNKSQLKWATIEKELCAISWACKKFRQYLLGHFFVFKTDHKPLMHSVVNHIAS